ncbi:MAG: SH3 domain-containing protein [Bacilli bacterium]|nr:SH3 domain-containing protein [Bacilli bacterium]
MKNILNKIISYALLFVMLFTILPPVTFAEEIRKGIVKSSKGNGINLRGGAGTSYPRVGGLDDGRIVNIISEVNTDDGTGSECAKWYKIVYDTGYAYACTTFINIIELTENPNYNYEEELAKFPESYKNYIKELHKIYPNAIFIAENATDKSGNVMDFNTAVKNENILGKSLVWDSNGSRDGLKNIDSYDLDTNTFYNKYSGGGKNWYAANHDTIAYYMDPRNFLNEERVFMFESQSYNPSLHTVAGIETILVGSFMSNTKVDGNGVTFAQAIIDAAIYSNVSPYFIAGRILQEVGTSRSSLVLGTYPSYPEFNGYYNYYNIGAGGDNVVYNGLSKAKENGWDSEYKSIVYGSSWIGNNYINAGQDTGYFQKWDVKCKGRSSCFSHQYMQNIEAPYSEALSTYKAYKKNNSSMYLNSYVFYIPVYSNMPEKTTLPNQSSPINYLSNITINKSVLANFNGLVNEYNLTVPYNTTSISVEATSVSSKAKISGIGTIKITSDKQDIVITVTAANGTTRNYTIHITREAKPKEEEVKPEQKPNETPKEEVKVTLSDAIAKIQGVRFNNNTISGVTSIDVLKEKVSKTGTNVSVSVKNKEGKVINSGNLGTGYKVNLSLNNETKEYQMVLYGDTNGDADITILDLLRVQKHLLKSITLSGSEALASDVNKDGSVTILDLLLVQKHLLGSKYINQ